MLLKLQKKKKIENIFFYILYLEITRIIMILLEQCVYIFIDVMVDIEVMVTSVETKMKNKFSRDFSNTKVNFKIIIK